MAVEKRFSFEEKNRFVRGAVFVIMAVSAPAIIANTKAIWDYYLDISLAVAVLSFIYIALARVSYWRERKNLIEEGIEISYPDYVLSRYGKLVISGLCVIATMAFAFSTYQFWSDYYLVHPTLPMLGGFIFIGMSYLLWMDRASLPYIGLELAPAARLDPARMQEIRKETRRAVSLFPFTGGLCAFLSFTLSHGAPTYWALVFYGCMAAFALLWWWPSRPPPGR